MYMLALKVLLATLADPLEHNGTEKDASPPAIVTSSTLPEPFGFATVLTLVTSWLNIAPGGASSSQPSVSSSAYSKAQAPQLPQDNSKPSHAQSESSQASFAPQASPQPPQLSLFDVVSMQVPSQLARAAAQQMPDESIAQLPLAHSAETLHGLLSLFLLMQLPLPQYVAPAHSSTELLEQEPAPLQAVKVTSLKSAEQVRLLHAVVLFG
jgi:hypothetical protein